MTVVGYRMRWFLCARARRNVVVVAVIAVVAGVVLGLAAGARRTQTAPDRLAASMPVHFDAEVQRLDGPPNIAEVRNLPGVSSVAAITFVFGQLGLEGDPPGDAQRGDDHIVFAGDPGTFGLRVISGRLPNPSVPGEFVGSADFATAAGVSIGDSFPLFTLTQEQADATGFNLESPPAPTLNATMVGVVDGASALEDSSSSVIFSPALLDDPQVGTRTTIMSVALAPGTSLTTLRAELDALPDGDELTVGPFAPVSGELRTAVRAEALGLWIVAGIGALAAIVALGQLLGRRVRMSPDEGDSLHALGRTRKELLAETATRAGVLATAGMIPAVAIACAISPMFPTGFVRRTEPHLGFSFDATVMIGGAVLAIAVLVGWVTATSLPRNPEAPRRLGLVEGLAVRCPGARLATALRFAFASGRSAGGVPAGTVGIAVLIGGLIAALTFGAGLHQLVTDRTLYGQNYDIMIDSGADSIPYATVDTINAQPEMIDVTLYSSSTERIDDDSYPVEGFEARKGSLLPVVVSGRAPMTPYEAALGRRTADRLGSGIDDDVTLSNVTGQATYRVVGIVVPAGIGGNDVVGEGIVTTRAGLFRLEPEGPPNAVAVNLAPGTTRATVERFAASIGMDPGGGLSRPPAIHNVARATFVPYTVAALLGGLTVIGLVGLLHLAVRRQHKVSGILRALGADGGWISATRRYQAVAMVLVPVVVAVPIGILGGCVIYRAFASNLGAIDTPVVPALVIVSVAVGLVLVGVAVASVVGQLSRKLSPAQLLRTE